MFASHLQPLPDRGKHTVAHSGDARDSSAPIYGSPSFSGTTSIGGTHIYQDSREKHSPSFFKTSNYESHKNFNPIRVENTCTWFLEHPTYLQWRDSKHNDLLWLTADPGCGKSVLSRALIDERLVAEDVKHVLYFFFKTNEEQCKATTAVCALSHQLFSSRQDLFRKHAIPRIETDGNAVKSELESLWPMFMDAARDPEAGSVVCILDALDECEEGDRTQIITEVTRFFREHGELSTGDGSRVKFILTSRPYEHIRRDIDRQPKRDKKVPIIRLAGEKESTKISEEITSVINTRIRDWEELLDLDNKAISALQAKLLGTSHRTYLWLHLISDEIEKAAGTSAKELSKLVETLPQTAEDAYELILQRCTNATEARKVLHIVIAAIRPITVSEMDLALALTEDFDCLEELNLLGEQKREDRIRSMCGLFVSVVDSKIYLIHETAKEFLIARSDSNPSTYVWKHSLVHQESHRLLADLCLTFIMECIKVIRQVLTLRDCSHTDLFTEMEKFEELGQTHELDWLCSRSDVLYLIKHWAHHCSEVELDADDLLTASMLEFYESEPWALRSFLPDEDPEEEIWMHASLTHQTVFHDHAVVLKLHLRREPVGDEPSKTRDLAETLYLAAKRGSEKVVRVILERFIEVDALPQALNSCISPACVCEGRHEPVRFTPDFCSIINFRGGKYGTALQAASYMGNECIVKMLLNAGTDVDINAGIFGTALQAACVEDYRAIVEILLDNGANVNIRGGYFYTALHAASYRGRENVIKMLLDAGADYDIQGGKYGSVLKAALGTVGRDSGSFRILVEAGADVRSQVADLNLQLVQILCSDRTPEEEDTIHIFREADTVVQLSGRTMNFFVYAFRWASKISLGILLEAGGRAALQQDRAHLMIALTESCFRKDEPEDVFQMLLDAAAEEDILSVFHTAWENGDEAVARMLWKLYNTTHNQDRMQNVPRFFVENRGDADIDDLIQFIMFMLSLGADLDYQEVDISGFKQLMWRTRVQQWLSGTYGSSRDSGKDALEARSYYLEQALEKASRSGHPSSVSFLLESGVKVNTEGTTSPNMLYTAFLGGHNRNEEHTAGNKEVIRILLERDFDPNVPVDSTDATLLQMAAHDGSDDLVELLLGFGADITAQSNEYGNALWTASKQGHHDTVMVLIRGLQCWADRQRFAEAVYVETQRIDKTTDERVSDWQKAFEVACPQAEFERIGEMRCRVRLFDGEWGYI